MIRGIDSNPIMVGAYTDRGGAVCPMLAAHRNGGRTNFASFARAWDDFTGETKRPRRATRREVMTLRAYLEMSLLADDDSVPSLVEAAKEIRAQRGAAAAAGPGRSAKPRRSASEDRFHVWDLRGRRRRRRARERAELDLYEATYAASLSDPAHSLDEDPRVSV